MTPAQATHRLAQMQKMALLPAAAAIAPWLLKNVGGAIATDLVAKQVMGAVKGDEKPATPTTAPTATKPQPVRPTPWQGSLAKAGSNSHLAFQTGFEVFCKEAGFDTQDAAALLALAQAIESGHVKVAFDPTNPFGTLSQPSLKAPAPKAPGIGERFMNWIAPKSTEQDAQGQWGWSGRTGPAAGAGGGGFMDKIKGLFSHTEPTHVSPRDALEQYNKTYGDTRVNDMQKVDLENKMNLDANRSQMEDHLRRYNLTVNDLSPERLESLANRYASGNAKGVLRGPGYSTRDEADRLMKIFKPANQATAAPAPAPGAPAPAAPPAAPAPAPMAPLQARGQGGVAPAAAAAGQAAAPAPGQMATVGQVPVKGTPPPAWANNTPPAAPAAGAGPATPPAPAAPKPPPEAPAVT